MCLATKTKHEKLGKLGAVHKWRHPFLAILEPPPPPTVIISSYDIPGTTPGWPYLSLLLCTGLCRKCFRYQQIIERRQK